MKSKKIWTVLASISIIQCEILNAGKIDQNIMVDDVVDGVDGYTQGKYLKYMPFE